MCCLKVYETNRTDTNLKMSVCYLVTWKALNDQSDPSLWTLHFHYTPIKTCKVQGADKQNRHNNSSAFLSLCILIKCLEKHLIQVYCWTSLMLLSLFQKNINKILKYKNFLYNKKNPILIRRIKIMYILFCKNCSKGNILRGKMSTHIHGTKLQVHNTIHQSCYANFTFNMFSKLTFDLKNQVRAAPSLLFRIHLIPMTLQMLLAKKYSIKM